MEVDIFNAVINLYKVVLYDSTNTCSFQQIKLQNFFHTMHHTFTNIFSKCKHATMSQKHRQDQGSFAKKNQREQTRVMVQYEDLIDMQIMDAVGFIYNVVTSSNKYNNLIYNVIIWLLDVQCVEYNLAIEKEAIIITIYLYIANSHSQQDNIFIEYSKKFTFIFIKITIQTILLVVHI